MDTETMNAPITGHPLFFLTSILYIPNHLNLDEIKNKDENNYPISENMISNMRNIYKSVIAPLKAHIATKGKGLSVGQFTI